MCDPVSIGLGLLGGAATKAVTKPSGSSPSAAMPDPAAERARAEAEAQQSANAKLAGERQRMRGRSLLAQGATSPLSTNAAAPTQAAQPFTRGQGPQQAASLMSRGGSAPTFI